MNAFKTLVPAVALAAGLALSASANAATTVTIGLSGDNGSTIFVQGVPGVTSSNISNQAFGVWSATVDAHVGFFPDPLNTNTFDAASTGPGQLDIFVTVQGLTTFAPGFLSGFTENLLTNGWSVTESTYVDTNNGLFTTVTPLASHVFTTGATGVNVVSGGTAGPSPYSVTERFHIAANGQGNAQSTIDITAVPEPTTWALMIFGFGGVGAVLRRRRTTAAFA
ncbi:MAG: PEPxxWA-CTERM sorting domain-containing protein [Phenylobacterium sp.]